MNADIPSPARFSVVVPAHKAEGTIGPCLDALVAAGFAPAEILVVDDGSPDATGKIARDRGVTVVVNETAQRPARARNGGAAATAGEIIVFVDSDVVVHPGLRARLERHFADPGLVAVIGSYDDRPTGSVVSRYRNLLHHLTHQRAAGPTPTFWSGLGAVRRDAFQAAGGFDPAWEDIEDVELGLRISAAGGAIRLDPDMQGTHLKQWTPRSLFRTDLYGRAIPWTRLLQQNRIEMGALNTAASHRVSAVALILFAAGLLGAPLLGQGLLLLSAVAIALFLAANARLLADLSRIGGPLFAVRSLPWHALHYVAAILGYARVRLLERG